QEIRLPSRRRVLRVAEGPFVTGVPARRRPNAACRALVTAGSESQHSASSTVEQHGSGLALRAAAQRRASYAPSAHVASSFGRGLRIARVASFPGARSVGFSVRFTRLARVATRAVEGRAASTWLAPRVTGEPPAT